MTSEGEGEPTFGVGQLTHCPYHQDEKLDHLKEELEEGKIIEKVGCPECGKEFVITYEAKTWRELP